MSIQTRITDCADLDPARLGISMPAWRDGRRPDDASLVAFAKTFRLSHEAWAHLAPYLSFDARQYKRVRVFRNTEWEALLLCWLPGQATNIHDHGGSVGVSAVLAGDLREIRYRHEAEGSPLAVAGHAACPPGSAAVEFIDTIHEIRNDGRQPAVSLHMYSPPLTTLGAYDAAVGTRWDVGVADSPDVQVGGDPNLTPHDVRLGRNAGPCESTTVPAAHDGPGKPGLHT